MRAFAVAWPEQEMLQSDIAALPWGHITLLLDKLSDRPTRDWYAARASGWSGAELEHHIASRLQERQAAAISNFDRALPADDAEAVQRITRDPVVLDFVRLTEGAKESDLEAALLTDIERFMLALGEGFYFAGTPEVAPDRRGGVHPRPPLLSSPHPPLRGHRPQDRAL
jgi:predicted nuclease of restriction endonuclease-like (RecB) superfamily